MRVFHIERREGTSRCNAAKPKDSLIPVDSPMTEDAEGDVYANNGETRRVCGKCLVGLWVQERQDNGQVLLSAGVLTS